MLKGTRCRAVPPPSNADLAAVSDVPLQALHSFSNAERVAAATGRSIVKGFLAGGSISCRRWPLWQGRQPDGGGQRLLVESPLGEKEAAPLTASGRAFACALAVRLAAGQVPPAPPRQEPSPAAAAPASSEPTARGGTAKVAVGPSASKSSGRAASSGTLDYAKWDALAVSDEEEEEADQQRNATAVRRAAEQRSQEEEMVAAFKGQQDSVTSAMDAAVAATTAGNIDALDEMSAAARAAAPLPADMEELIATLPLAAQIAARAAVANAAGIRGVDAGAGGGGSLQELLAGAAIASGTDDPGLEDPREFFHNDA
eukprot:scaffold47880_cov185-Isochrysis_galbana.AAC.1